MCACPIPPATNFAQKCLLLLIRAYQLSFSVLFGRSCRFLPTCSEYAREAVMKHGAGKGAWMAVRRMARCHPWGGNGYDPVP
jgi:uncharacterized protein